MSPPDPIDEPQTCSEDAFTPLAREAMASAALRLGVDPIDFAGRCGDGALADVVFELRMARHALAAKDRSRIEDLLRSVGVLP